uniref:Uncharacterized protein n=1 Tax=Panagrolaimus sp. JU765 TaxID=591449 RepID=A0AC34QZJ8_9BILA
MAEVPVSPTSAPPPQPPAGPTTSPATTATVAQDAQQLPPPPATSPNPKKTAPVLDIENFELKDAVPTEEAVNEKTQEADPNPLEVGEFTQDLSDVSDQDGEQEKRTLSRNALSTWFRRIQPLVRNKRVRAFAILNSILTALNLILFVACVVMLGFLLFEIVEVAHKTAIPKPCIYQWGPWGECSQTCRERFGNGTAGPVPTRTRKILNETIVQARGNAKKCPDNLESLVDVAPCNTYLCPKPLSSYDKMKVGDKCIYNIPKEDALITIDTDSMYPTECKEASNNN